VTNHDFKNKFKVVKLRFFKRICRNITYEQIKIFSFDSQSYLTVPAHLLG